MSNIVNRLTLQKHSTCTTSRQIIPQGRIWPNGEFGYAVAEDHSLEEIMREEVERGCGGSLLVSTQPPNSHTPPRGLKGITSYGARVVRSGAVILERHGKENLSFLTLTLPSVGPETLLAYARDWSRIVRVFFQRFSRLLERRSLPSEYVAVTEVQTKREDRDGEFPLHIHACFVGRTGRGHWRISPGEVRWIWASVLGQSVCLLGGGEDSIWMGSVENMQQIRKSAEGYLGKYMSKGGGHIQEYADKYGEAHIPKAWYSIKRSLLARIKKEMITTPVLISALSSLVASGQKEHFSFLRPIELQDENGAVCVIGYYGRLTAQAYQDFRELRDLWRQQP